MVCEENVFKGVCVLCCEAVDHKTSCGLNLSFADAERRMLSCPELELPSESLKSWAAAMVLRGVEGERGKPKCLGEGPDVRDQVFWLVAVHEEQAHAGYDRAITLSLEEVGQSWPLIHLDALWTVWRCDHCRGARDAEA